MQYSSIITFSAVAKILQNPVMTKVILLFTTQKPFGATITQMLSLSISFPKHMCIIGTMPTHTIGVSASLTQPGWRKQPLHITASDSFVC